MAGSVVAVEFDIKSVNILCCCQSTSQICRLKQHQALFSYPNGITRFRLWRHLLDFRVRQYNEELQYLEWYHSRDPTLPEDENETTQGISTETIIIKTIADP